MFKRIKQWKLRKKQNTERDDAAELREFIYLDEVSITSLLSSRLGAIPSEFKETFSDSLSAEASGQIQANAIVAKTKIGSKFSTSISADRQIVRKATIQATFKDLYEGERKRLAVSLPKEGENASADIIKQPKDIEKIAQPWALTGSQLKQGRLAELSVELQADPIFRVSSIISVFATMFEKSKLLSSQINDKSITDATEVNRILEQLMDGLIPLKCRVIDYEVVTIDGNDYIVHSSVLGKMSDTDRPESRPLYLTGVTEQGLFWKDIRRVLFSKARVKVLCRLNKDGLSSAWLPVKLVNVLGEVAPEVAETMRGLGDTTLEAMTSGYKSQSNSVETGVNMFVLYADAVAKSFELKLTNKDKTDIAGMARPYTADTSPILTSCEGFKVVTVYLQERFNVVLTDDRELLSTMRETARKEYALQSITDHKGATNPPKDETNDAYIDAEVIAIYW